MIVIADDITGAAEIAGIAQNKGRQVRLLCGCPDDDVAAGDGVTVIATDSRSMREEEAVSETRRIAAALKGQQDVIFKKTDSALRGHVVAELKALMQATGYRRAVYLPANPSKGRVIRGGIYYINDTPLSETAFSYDPEFPAKTSLLKERFPEAEANGIVMPDAESDADIAQVVAQYHDGKTLFAGAADLFSALCNRQQRSRLILCGSTQSKPLELGIPIAPMPQEIYDGSEDVRLWDTSAYDRQRGLILTIPYTHRTGKEVAEHLRNVMAKKVQELVALHQPDQLIIEGGATAWATLQALGWAVFDIEQQIAPGVVKMRAANGTEVILKPGSYPWGTLMD